MEKDDNGDKLVVLAILALIVAWGVGNQGKIWSAWGRLLNRRKH